MADVRKLEQRWLRWWKAVGATGDGRAAFKTIEAYYTESYRYYHNLDHLEHCFEEFDRTRHLASRVLALELAIWLHDVVYNPYAKKNEEHSARFAERLCRQAKLGHIFGKLVANLIRATDHRGGHRPGKDANLLLDIDLAILGQPPERFAEYQRAIRKEYAWVPDDEYREGRRKILELVSKRTTVYRTKHFQERYESEARTNLESALRELGG